MLLAVNSASDLSNFTTADLKTVHTLIKVKSHCFNVWHYPHKSLQVHEENLVKNMFPDLDGQKKTREKTKGESILEIYRKSKSSQN